MKISMTSCARAFAVLGAMALAAAGCHKNKPRPQDPEQAETTSASAYSPPGVESEPLPHPRPRRIILMIGDGMGVPAVTAASYAKGAPLQMLQMPHVGLMRTHEHEFMTTDSAASATAFATGHKTHYEGVSVTPGTTPTQQADPDHRLETMVEVARRAGWRTGLVATSRITHATPAAFASHQHNRRSYEAIAAQMASAQVDVMLGAGSRYFSKREDGQDLLAQLEERGWVVAPDVEGVRAAADGETSRLVGLLHDKDMPPIQEGGRAMSLSQMTGAALRVLDREQPEGFFLMVEGSQIDWEEHAMDGPGAVAETLDFDEAVGVARAYAASREDTLVIVTADHETGGLSVLDPPSAQPYLERVGGLEGARQATGAGPDAYPDPVDSVPLGQKERFGPPELEDARLITSYGHLSVASRAGWEGEGSFIATHTATMVPLMAQGVGAEHVAQIQDNADLGRLLRAMILSQAEDAELEPDEQALLKRQRDVFALERPRNVILIVGDGMGASSITAAYYARGGLAMTQAPVQGLVATHGVDRLVNDSAATATALATGRRARYRTVGVAPGQGGELEPATSVLERAEAQGLRTGLITSTTLTHATPAAFYAHQPNRGREDLIAGQFVDLPGRVEGADGIDVAFGGGAERFAPEQLEVLRERGVLVSTEWSDEPAPPDAQVMRLLAPEGLPEAPARLATGAEIPSLARMTRSALRTLAPSPRGFFLMVEGGQIDWAMHGLERGARLIDEVADLDAAAAEALAFARERGDTLVIITADHDHTLSLLDNHYGFARGHCGAATRCGGSVELEQLPLAAEGIHRGEGLRQGELQGEWAPAGIVLQYAWLPQAASIADPIPGPHAAHFVPLFAYGPGAEAVGGFRQQPEIGQALLRWAHGRPLAP